MHRHPILQKRVKHATLAVSSVALGSLFAGQWLPVSNPARLNSNYVYNINQLPTEGHLKNHTPWSDSYWPSKTGGISYRYQTGEKFNYRLHTLAELQGMPRDQLAKLSPSEKFDLARGYYNYPLTRTVFNYNSPDDPYWWGICHGWAPAAGNHAEPKPIDFKNGDGLVIPFGSSDVKALMSYYYGIYAYNQRVVRQLGSRCETDARTGFLGLGGPVAECRDVNPGALHVALANQFGLMDRPLLADVTRGKEVWNQPLLGYRSEIVAERKPKRDSAPGTQRLVRVITHMDYVNEISPNWQPVVGTRGQNVASNRYVYWLEIDPNNRIIGGEWIHGKNPDFFWTVEPMAFTGEFALLGQIYRP